VEIEVHAGWGKADEIAVVGPPDTAVKESNDRVTSATWNSGLRWPYGKRITINLAPADVRKELRPVKGVLSIALEARRRSLTPLC
jgi:magnesium chelatase family protein